jgi:outer membrane receptor protein involved in Fe transport
MDTQTGLDAHPGPAPRPLLRLSAAPPTPRAALVWAMDYNLTAKLLYGRAFRAPSFVEMYAINNPAALGNPNLKPETTDTWEAAVVWQPSGSTQWV